MAGSVYDNNSMILERSINNDLFVNIAYVTLMTKGFLHDICHNLM